ncbi:MAG: helix-turn-helix domain-containing protein [Terriglobales bacterium]
MKCSTCGAEARIEKGDFDMAELGVPNVVLRGLEILVCKSCGSRDPMVPRLADLMRTIAAAFLAKPAKLAGTEVKFLRTRAELTQAQFAELLHVDRTTVTKWETGEWPLPASSDVAIRSVIRLLDDTLRASAEVVRGELTGIDEAKADPLHVLIDAGTLRLTA